MKSVLVGGVGQRAPNIALLNQPERLSNPVRVDDISD